MPIFAKFAFTAFLTLQAGMDLPWPTFWAQQLGSGITTAGHFEGERMDPIGWIGEEPLMRQLFCVDSPGVYNVVLSVGMYPNTPGQPDASGWIQLITPMDAVILTGWKASGEWTLQQGTAAVWMQAPGCMYLRYLSTGPATVNPDPRATFLTIHRAG